MISRVQAHLLAELAAVVDHELVERRADRVGDAVVQVEHPEHRARLDEQPRARRLDKSPSGGCRVGGLVDHRVDELDQELAVLDAAITRPLGGDLT